ncbi:hypothetical protein GPALN_005229 [Globodera pallida]|nr:hypothetical protein GPALN_005229 [Globodera pallida]
MATDFLGKDELLAQAILDLELKMKHEIRQNNAYLLSKIEKHYEQTDKKLSSLEAKMEAISRDREDRQQSHSSRGGRRTNYFAANHYTHNNPGGRAQMPGVDSPRVGRPSEKTFERAVPVPPNPANQQQHPYKVFGMGGGGNTPANRQQFKPNTEKPPADGHGHGGRYKQTLGTSKAQTTSPSTIQNQWTTKAAGLYTDDEDSSDSSASQKSESKHLVAKPHQQEELEEQLRKEDGYEKLPAEVVDDGGDGMAVFEDVVNGQKVFVGKFETCDEVAGNSDVQSNPSVEVETHDRTAETSTAAVTAMLNIKENHQPMSTVTPGAIISPVLGDKTKQKMVQQMGNLGALGDLDNLFRQMSNKKFSFSLMSRVARDFGDGGAAAKVVLPYTIYIDAVKHLVSARLVAVDYRVVSHFLPTFKAIFLHLNFDDWQRAMEHFFGVKELQETHRGFPPEKMFTLAQSYAFAMEGNANFGQETDRASEFLFRDYGPCANFVDDRFVVQCRQLSFLILLDELDKKELFDKIVNKALRMRTELVMVNLAKFMKCTPGLMKCAPPLALFKQIHDATKTKGKSLLIARLELGLTSLCDNIMRIEKIGKSGFSVVKNCGPIFNEEQQMLSWSSQTAA